MRYLVDDLADWISDTLIEASSLSHDSLTALLLYEIIDLLIYYD